MLGLLLLRLARDLVAEAPDPAHGEDDDRHGDDGDQGQAPVQDEDGDDGEDDGGHVLGDAGQGAGDDVLDAGDVVVDPAHDLAGLGHGVEAQRLALQVGEELQAQVGHDRLPDAVVQVLLQHAHQAGHDGRRRPARSTSQLSWARFPLGTASSTISRMNSGGSSASSGGDGDAQQHAGRRPEVRTQVGDHPAQLGDAHRAATAVTVAEAHPVQPVGSSRPHPIVHPSRPSPSAKRGPAGAGGRTPEGDDEHGAQGERNR